LTAASALATGIDRMLAPRSVAVVGATDRDGSYGAQALINLTEIGFTGPVWGVNPSRTEVLGRPCVASVSDLPEPVDAVIVAIPAAGVPDVIDAAGARGCGGAVVFSAGFEEVASGRELAVALRAAADRHGLPVCGPNCNGIVAPGRRVALWGDALAARAGGRVALVSQSGNVSVNALAARRGLRFHTVIASGNQTVLSTADYLEALSRQDDLGAVALYLEDDGGVRLVDGLAACADAGVPVVVLKVGRSAAGARAAAAHSGALAGDQRVFRSLIQEAGAAWADDVHELLELSKTLAVRQRSRPAARAPREGGLATRRLATRGLAIMTCSGGDSAQGADEAARLGLTLPELAPATLARLREALPSTATAGNPLDYTAMIWGDVEALAELVHALGEDPAIDLVLVFYDQPYGLTGATAESWAAVRQGIMLGARRSPALTLVSSTLPELLDEDAACTFADEGVPAAAGLRTGLRCTQALLSGATADGDRLRAIARGARSGMADDGAADGGWLAEHEAKALLGEGGVPVPAGRVVHGSADAVAAAAELGGPIALKVSAATIQHKSELGAVALGLSGTQAIIDADLELSVIADAHHGVVFAEEMVAGGLELIVAAHRDGIVPALVIGLGGVWTELLGDVAVVPLPASPERIIGALRSLRGAGLLLGGRGSEVLDLDAAAALAARVGELLIERSLSVIECNPVRVGVDGAVALDAAIRRLGATELP
jgi:acyl-CoA synthetase (NDP forming)